jgi:hypothetical protein
MGEQHQKQGAPRAPVVRERLAEFLHLHTKAGRSPTIHGTARQPRNLETAPAPRTIALPPLAANTAGLYGLLYDLRDSRQHCTPWARRATPQRAPLATPTHGKYPKLTISDTSVVTIMPSATHSGAR